MQRTNSEIKPTNNQGHEFKRKIRKLQPISQSIDFSESPCKANFATLVGDMQDDTLSASCKNRQT